MIRILVAAGSAMARAGLAALLRARPVFDVIASEPLERIAQAAEEARPDAVVLELDARDAAGADELLAGLPGDCAIVILTEAMEPGWGLGALRNGARAVLPSRATEDQLVAAIEAAAAGLAVIDPSDLPYLAPPRPASSEGLDPLSPRELEVLRMMADGAGNKEIAFRMGISEHTVKFHVGSIMSKLGAGSRTEAVTVGIRRGWIAL